MTDGKAIGLIAALVVLLAFSAFFSATETAYTGFSQARMKKLAQKKKTARLALGLSGDYNKILSTLLIGNNIVNIAAASLATLVFTHYFGDLGVTLSTAVMTVTVLIFGEISPKSIAKERPEAFAAATARPLKCFTILFAPLVLLFDLWKKLLTKLFRLDKKQPSMTEEEFQIIVNDIKDEGVLNETEREIILNSMRYDETTVGDAMTPAERVTAIGRAAGPDAIKETFRRSNYSRVPVYRKNLSDLCGIMYRTDFYEMLLDGKFEIGAVLKPPFYTEPGERISTLFKRMQRAREALAVVRKDGSVVGLISMEDILEELVGEIDDRHDAEHGPIAAAT